MAEMLVRRLNLQPEGRRSKVRQIIGHRPHLTTGAAIDTKAVGFSIAISGPMVRRVPLGVLGDCEIERYVWLYAFPLARADANCGRCV